MVLLDNNGEPKIFQHEASFFKKGKMMDYETLHKFVSECIGKEYSDRQYTIFDTSFLDNDECDIMIKAPSGKMICGKIVLTDDTFAEVIAKTDFGPLFGYCRKNKAFPRLYTVSAWCFATPEGSKMINGSSFAFKIDSISLLDKDDEEQTVSIANEALLKIFADAWNNRDASRLNDILSSHVHYSSSFVFDELRGRTETVAYLNELFKKFKSSDSNSLLSLCIDSSSGDLMLADVSKNGVFSFKFSESRIIDIHLSELERSRVAYVDFGEKSVWEPVELQSSSESVVDADEEEQVDVEQCLVDDVPVAQEIVAEDIVVAESVEDKLTDEDIVESQASIGVDSNPQPGIEEGDTVVPACENDVVAEEQVEHEESNTAVLDSLRVNITELEKDKEKLQLRIKTLEEENKQLKQMYATVSLELARIKEGM